MHRPRIGISLCLDERGRWRPGRPYHYIDGRYADAVSRAGGVPLYLPIQDDVGSLVTGIDGLLLPGGDDLPPDPARGDSPADMAQLDLVPQAQLAFDTSLLRAALESHQPVLGICYGMQLLAREGGGRLDTHLPSQRPEAQDHKLASDEARHAVAVEAGSRLSVALGATSLSVNSLHHQAVAEVGARHIVVARSPDGIVEGIEGCESDGPFEIGVQWHPEKMDDPENDNLFRAFISACRDRAPKG